MSDTTFTVKINDTTYDVKTGTTIIQLLNEHKIAHPQVCYNPIVDPIETCDTCIVEADGQLVRACSTPLTPNMNIQLNSVKAKASQTEAMDRILENHSLYCTVCDNNN